MWKILWFCFRRNYSCPVGGHHWLYTAHICQPMCFLHHKCISKVSLYFQLWNRVFYTIIKVTNYKLFYFLKILADWLQAGSGVGQLCFSAVQRDHLCSVYGQVCHICKDSGSHRSPTALLLHDRWQDGQDPGAARELYGGCTQPRRWGTVNKKISRSLSLILFPGGDCSANSVMQVCD